jgi:hypothetical protein
MEIRACRNETPFPHLIHLMDEETKVWQGEAEFTGLANSQLSNLEAPPSSFIHITVVSVRIFLLIIRKSVF